MNRLTCTLASGILGLLVFAPSAAQAGEGTQDLVFLGKARPVFIRMHIRVDGKPLHQAWDEMVAHVFRHLDINDDGILGRTEAERIPSARELLGGAQPRRRRRGKSSTKPLLETLDSNKDGKVAQDELATYYRNNGLAPFRIQKDNTQSNTMRMAASMYSGSKPQPPVQAVSKGTFTLLDTNKDQKLSKAELAVAPARVLPMDENENELLTPQELAPKAIPDLNPLSLGRMMSSVKSLYTSKKELLIPLTTPGKKPVDLADELQKRYAAKKGSPLKREHLGLDLPTFALLDTNKDRQLDGKELAKFARRPPDLEVTIHLEGQKSLAQPGALRRARSEERAQGTGEGTRRSALIEVSPSRDRPRIGKLQKKHGLTRLDLGQTQLELRGVKLSQSSPFDGFIRQQILAQLKRADANGDGIIDEKEGKSRRFRGLFKKADRDGDNKVTLKELNTYLDQANELQSRANASCATLILSNESRGLFTLFDANSDSQLSIRELRQGPKFLKQFAQPGKSYLTQADIPNRFQLTVQQGPGNQRLNNARAFFDLYRQSTRYEPKSANYDSPRWFRKMDTNRDGDISRKEFLFSKAAFRQLDTDGDDLISPEEAKKAKANKRK